jgi:hypothetical protein
MGGGYTAESQKLLDYSQTLGGYASSLGEAGGAAGDVTSANQINVSVNSTNVSLDGAFGVLYAPVGAKFQEYSKHMDGAIGNIVSMMSRMAANIKACGQAYGANEGAVSKNLAAIHERIDPQQTKQGG